jgi:hypothetical protein
MKYKRILFYFILFALLGCMTDRTAIMKVLTNPSSFDSVGRVYERLHPCSNDTIIKGSDTSYLHDTTVQSFSFVDTVTKIQHDSVVKKYFTTATVHDTIEIRDNQILDDNTTLRAANSTLQALYSDSNNRIGEANKTIDKWQFWAILLGCIAGLLGIGLILKSSRIL